MRARQLTFVVIGLLSIYGCGGTSPSPDASDLPKDTPTDKGGSDASVDKPDTAADAKDAVDAADVANDAPNDAIDGGGDADVGGLPPCTVATECPGQDSECQHRTCTAGVCGTANETTGKVLATQVIGDCHVRQCGANGVVAIVVDDNDIPDDINPCTTDACASGVPSHSAVAKDTTCGGGKLCNATGQCLGCNLASDCPGTDNFCHTRTCAQNICGVTNKAAGTKLADSTSGDCKIQQCDGQGVIQTVADATDLPVDNNPCTQDQCNGETPTHQPVARNTSCGGAQVCDGASHCVTCLTPTTCPGTDTECQSRTCTNGACGTSFAAAGKVIAAQTTGDCSQKQCDGHGVVVGVSDTTDPFVDNNPCTSDLCVNGSPSNPNLPTHTNCGPNLQCDGNGLCVTCVTVADCPGTDTECNVRTCVAGRCGANFSASGTPVSTQTVGDCKRNQCDGQGAVTTVIDNADTPNDSNPCTQDLCNLGTVQHLPESTQVTCGVSGHCDGLGTCVGCNVDTDCGSTNECQMNTCNQTTHACNPTVLTPVDTALATQALGDCKKVVCDGNGSTKVNIDKADVPTDSDDCTVGACADDGTPSNPIVVDHPCQTNGVCKGDGTCVGCNTDAECGSANNTECRINTCLNNVCSIATSPTAGTLCSSAGGNRCDGQGNCLATFMVVRVGSAGGSAPVADATAVSIETRTESDGTVIGTPISIPSTMSDAFPFTLSGSADSEGGLALSGDKHYVSLAGYAAVAGTAGVAGSDPSKATGQKRSVALISANGTVDTSTSLGTIAFSKNNPRSAVTNNGMQFWVGGAGDKALNAGVFYAAPIGATTSLQLEQATNSTRYCQIFFGALYCTAKTTPYNSVFQVGPANDPLPTAIIPMGTGTTPLNTASGTASPGAFVLLDRTGNDGIPDVMYIADDLTPGTDKTMQTGGIEKWHLVGNSWVLDGTFNTNLTVGVRGLSAHDTGGSVVLIGTTAPATSASAYVANEIVKYVDDGTAPAASIGFTVLVPAATTASAPFRGVSLPPQ